MRIRSYRVALNVFDAIAEAADFAAARDGEAAGDRVQSNLFAALDRIANSDPTRGIAPTSFPQNYRRLKVKPYLFYYRFNLENADVLVYLLRHERQRPYTPATHRRKAAEAEKRNRQLRGGKE